MATLLAALRDVARECQLAARGLCDEQAAEGLAIAEELRALFLPPADSAPASSPLLRLPADLLSVILSRLDTRDLARLAVTCRLLWLDAPTPPLPPRVLGPVETELRERAEARGLDVGSFMPDGATSWVACLLKRDRRDELGRQAPLAVGQTQTWDTGNMHSIFVDREGRLLTCGREIRGEYYLGHAVNPAADPHVERWVGLPTPVPSVQDRRFVSVATSGDHCLALSAEGEVYSWGNGEFYALGHADGCARAVPSRIESLSHIERIAAGLFTSAAINSDGRLLTWGRARRVDMPYFASNEDTGHSGLGYELDTKTEYQLTPKRVDALSHHRVVGVALGGIGFTLAVTDAGAVFSFGCGEDGVLGHEHGDTCFTGQADEVLPRRIEALAQTGRRFVAVAAGDGHALALTEEGELYGWGHECANGHGHQRGDTAYEYLTASSLDDELVEHYSEHYSEHTPRLVAALIGVRVKLVDAQQDASCAVTEKGELFIWGDSLPFGNGDHYNLGHGVSVAQVTPKRVGGLSGVRVAAVAICESHTLVADEDGAVWSLVSPRRSA